MARRCEARCLACAESHEGINGRYCDRYRRWVEHGAVAGCDRARGDEGDNKKYDDNKKEEKEVRI